MFSNNPAHHVLVDVHAEGQRNLLGNSRTTPGSGMFSAARARRDREVSTARWTISRVTEDSVVRLCLSSWKMRPGMNAQLYMLRDVMRLPTEPGRNFCGPHGWQLSSGVGPG